MFSGFKTPVGSYSNQYYRSPEGRQAGRGTSGGGLPTVKKEYFAGDAAGTPIPTTSHTDEKGADDAH